MNLSLALLVALMTTTAQAQVSEITCEEKLPKCEQLILFADHAIKQQADVINMLDTNVTELEKVVEAQRRELSRKQEWYQSKELWFAVGAVAGVAVGLQF